MRGVLVRLVILFSVPVFAMTQDASNAYLLEWTSSASSTPEITRLELLTGFNSRGYNNQPYYDGRELYLSSSWKSRRNSQTNIIALDLNEHRLRQITDTKDSEYSPTVMQSQLYFVRQNPENNFQELWAMTGQTLQKILPETNVAYFCPISPERLAVVLIDNNQLNLYDINLITNEKKKITENVGRTLAYGQNGVLYFVHKYNEETWYIKSYDILTEQIRIVCKTLPVAEDFVLDRDRYLWMAKDNRIYQSTIENGLASPWKNIFHLENYPLNNIGRMCVIGDNQLVFINH